MSPEAPVAAPARTVDRAALLLLALASVQYFAFNLWYAAHNPLWMDEVLAVWTARQPTLRAIWAALEAGSDFSPPLYHSLLHGLVALGGDNPLVLRLPSVLGVFLVGLSSYGLVRRRASTPLAALAMVLCLSSGLVLYAQQVRMYALVSACFAVALWLWDGAGEGAVSWRRAAGLALALALAVGLHFYAILLAVAVGLIELLWMIRHRRIRWPFIAAIGVGGLSIGLWLPIALKVSTFNKGDVHAWGYYAKPTLERLASSYVDTLLGHQLLIASPLAVAAWVGLCALIFNRGRARPQRWGDLDLVLWVSAAVPVLVFVFAVTVSHTFNARYVAGAMCGFAVVIALWVRALPKAEMLACALIAVLMAEMASPPRHMAVVDVQKTADAVIRAAPAGLPIYTGNGLRYLVLRENLPPPLAERVVFVEDRPEAVSPDPTDLHQVQRWLALDPKLAHIATEALPHPALVYYDHSAIDLLASPAANGRLVASKGHSRLVLLP